MMRAGSDGGLEGEVMEVWVVSGDGGERVCIEPERRAPGLGDCEGQGGREGGGYGRRGPPSVAGVTVSWLHPHTHPRECWRMGKREWATRCVRWGLCMEEDGSGEWWGKRMEGEGGV